MKYNKFSYIYPTRPKSAAPISDIGKFDNNTLVGQPKINGSNCEIYSNGKEFHVYNRHGEVLTNFQLDKEEILDNLYKLKNNNWLCLNGEYLNKSKKDENNITFNHKLILFDILVYDSDYLIGKTFKDRIDLLDDICGKIDSEKEYLYGISENIYKVKSYYNNFEKLYNEFIKIDMVEGLVLKRINAKLQHGTSPNNNYQSMIKFRKPTKNYQF